mgnify:FL=1
MKDAERSFAPPDFQTWLGLRIVHHEYGFVRVELPVRPEFIQVDGIVHGGILATVADTAMGTAVVSTLEPGFTCFTIEMKVNYLQPVSEGTMIAEATVVRRGRRIAVTRGDVFDADGRLLLIGMGTFKIQGKTTTPTTV